MLGRGRPLTATRSLASVWLRASQRTQPVVRRAANQRLEPEANRLGVRLRVRNRPGFAQESSSMCRVFFIHTYGTSTRRPKTVIAWTRPTTPSAPSRSTTQRPPIGPLMRYGFPHRPLHSQALERRRDMRAPHRKPSWAALDQLGSFAPRGRVGREAGRPGQQGFARSMDSLTVSPISLRAGGRAAWHR